jgi:hypothetical protein
MNGNLDDLFRPENQACSPALSDVGSLCLGTKGDLLMSFERSLMQGQGNQPLPV